MLLIVANTPFCDCSLHLLLFHHQHVFGGGRFCFSNRGGVNLLAHTPECTFKLKPKSGASAGPRPEEGQGSVGSSGADSFFPRVTGVEKRSGLMPHWYTEGSSNG